MLSDLCQFYVGFNGGRILLSPIRWIKTRFKELNANHNICIKWIRSTKSNYIFFLFLDIIIEFEPSLVTVTDILDSIQSYNPNIKPILKSPKDLLLNSGIFYCIKVVTNILIEYQLSVEIRLNPCFIRNIKFCRAFCIKTVIFIIGKKALIVL